MQLAAIGIEAVACRKRSRAKHGKKEWSWQANSFFGDVLPAEVRELQAESP